MGEIARLQQIIDESRNLVFFGGAGVSTESGIPDFRSVDGLYHQEWDFPPEIILSHTFFQSKPAEFYRFYQAKMLCDTAKPNAAHKKLAKLEEQGKLKAIVTQNIDNLHQMAGSKRVLELHGSVYRNHCVKCRSFYDFAYMKKNKGIPRCSKCGSIIKPDVVLYEEARSGCCKRVHSCHFSCGYLDYRRDVSFRLSGSFFSGLFCRRTSGCNQS